MNDLEKYAAKRRLVRAFIEKLANDPNVVVKNPKPGVTTMDFKRGTTFYGSNPPKHIQKARDAANSVLKPLSKMMNPAKGLPKPPATAQKKLPGVKIPSVMRPVSAASMANK